MICGGSRTCGCSFQSDSLQISNDGGLVTLESFGPSVVTSASRPSSPFIWQQIFETDTGLTWVWNGTAWKLQSWIIQPACELRRAANLSVPDAGGGTMVPYDLEDYDPFGWHSAGTPTRITPTIPGFYDLWCGGLWSSDTDYVRVQNAAIRNSTSLVPQHVDDSYVAAIASAFTAVPGAWVVFEGIEMNGTTDFLEHRVYQDNISNQAGTMAPRCIVRWARNN